MQWLLIAITEAHHSIAKEVSDDKAPERRASDDGDGGWVPPKEVGLFHEASLRALSDRERGAAPGGSRGVDGGHAQAGACRGARSEGSA
jgi:hypothetical protein